MFTSNDLDLIRKRGIPLTIIEKQIGHFKKGFPFVNLDRPATPEDGLLSFSKVDREFYIKYFDEMLSSNRIVKFVPASGAASRMFKHLFEFREEYRINEEGFTLYNQDQSFNSVYYLISHLEKIAFYSELCGILEKKGIQLINLILNKDFNKIIDGILNEEGLNYSNLPKGLIKFHDYPDGARTSAEEHLVEAAFYAKDQDDVARLHFTISPEHQEKFNSLISSVLKKYETLYSVKFDISFSIQKPATDTIAVFTDNEPFRNSDGSLLFRPGGHGALLDNLGDLDADMIFIKNIDNVVPDRLKQATFDYKKLIGGYLLFIRNKINGFLRKTEEGSLTSVELNEMVLFARRDLFLSFSSEQENLPDLLKQKRLVSMLNRPIRVCGMVKNEGEPGGGPFWVTDHKGDKSLQIVESSQIDLKNSAQAAIVSSSTHFNPVDIVCSTRDYLGNPFNLNEFVDEETGFISVKSSGGKSLKAQELPGLWNGAMANWITIFVEVPIITFNPVKTVNDLLRKEHSGGG